MAPSPPQRDDCITLEMSAVLHQGSSRHFWETFLFTYSYLRGQGLMSRVFLSHCPHLIFHSIIIIITRERAHKNVCVWKSASLRGQGSGASFLLPSLCGFCPCTTSYLPGSSTPGFPLLD